MMWDGISPLILLFDVVGELGKLTDCKSLIGKVFYRCELAEVGNPEGGFVEPTW